MLSPSDFDEMVDALFDQIVETVDASDAADDVELNQGVLEISCKDRTKIIINRHAPTQEIWIAAKSGGYHFRFANGVWRDTRSGEALSDAISRVFLEQTGERVTFD